MDASLYQQLSSRTGTYPTTIEFTPLQTTLVRGALGLSGESGEVLEHIKKHLFHKKELDVDHVKKELGDVMWYIVDICTTLDIDFGEVLKLNVEKLEVRYDKSLGDKANSEEGRDRSPEELKMAREGSTQEEVYEELLSRGYRDMDYPDDIEYLAELEGFEYDPQTDLWYEV